MEALSELKHLLNKHSKEIIEDLQLDESISLQQCIIGNSDRFCYIYNTNDECKYLSCIEGDKMVVAMILKKALCINNKILRMNVYINSIQQIVKSRL
jgi:hypothetical protein